MKLDHRLVVRMLAVSAAGWLTLAASAEQPESPDGGGSADLSLPAAAVLADLPMLEVADSGCVYFDLAPVGEPSIPVLLDTGFGPSIASRRALSQLGASAVEGKPNVYERNTLLGKPLRVHAARPQNERANDHRFIRLGGEFLRGYVLELDFESRRVRFLDRSLVSIPESVDAPDRAVVPLHIFNSRPTLQIQVNNRPVLVVLDTSASVPFWITPRELEKSAIDARGLPVIAARSDDRPVVRLFETDAVKLAGFDLGALPVIVSKLGHADAFGNNGQVIGLDVLKKFKLRLDITGKRLWLQRVDTSPVGLAGLPYSVTRSSGAFLHDMDEAFEVFGVLPGSPAEQMGLQPGDRLDRETLGTPTLLDLLLAIDKQVPLLVDRPTGQGRSYEQVLLPVVVPAPELSTSE